MVDRVDVDRQEEENRRIREETGTVGRLMTTTLHHRRTTKMMRVLQTRERSDRSQT